MFENVRQCVVNIDSDQIAFCSSIMSVNERGSRFSFCAENGETGGGLKVDKIY